MAGEKILVVEDEKDINDLIVFNLEKEGYTAMSTGTGEDGIKKAKSGHPDIILLDIMLPGINGLDVCRLLKTEEATRNIPVIMLTARNEDVDIITGLEVGADDYITKPFSPKVLIARIRAIFRRFSEQEKAATPVITFGDMVIDQGRHQVTIADSPVKLTLTEYQILLLLVRRPGWVFTRSQMIDDLREGHHVITDRAIDVQIANLRKKLGRHGDMIETIRGVGYRMQENP